MNFFHMLNKYIGMYFQTFDGNIFNAFGLINTVYQKYFIGKYFEINNLAIILIFSDYTGLK